MGPFHILLDQMGLDKVGRQDKLDVQWDPAAYLINSVENCEAYNKYRTRQVYTTWPWDSCIEVKKKVWKQDECTRVVCQKVHEQGRI